MIDNLYVAILASCRLGACLFLLPIFSARAVQRLTRFGIFFTLSLPIIAAAIISPDLANLGIGVRIALIFKEIGIGIAFGLPFSAVWWGARSAGFIVDQQRSFGAAQPSYTALTEQSTIMGAAFELTVSAYFLQIGGLAMVVGAIYRSYEGWPISEEFPTLGGLMTTSMEECFLIMFSAIGSLATVPLISILLIEIGTFIASRSAPNLASDFLVLPLKLLISATFAILSLSHSIDSGDLKGLFVRVRSYSLELSVGR